MTKWTEESLRPGERYFYCGDPVSIIDYLKRQCIIKPVLNKFKAARRLSSTFGVYRITGTDLKFQVNVHPEPMIVGALVVCDQVHLAKIYRIFCETHRQIRANMNANGRAIVAPTLPQRIKDKIQTTIFDFYEAIEALDTVRGFGNVGLIFAGPPGVGKSETMRWISDIAGTRFGRSTTTIGLSQLTKLLAEGVPLNTGHMLTLIDDIDANLLRDRRQTQNPLTSQFLTCIDGIDKREGRVIIISTNENLDSLDPALARPGRFETVIHFDYPTMDLIEEFCGDRGIELDPNLFEGWSFARIDMFLARARVAEYRYGTTLSAFYEKFVFEYGVEDATVTQVQQEAWERQS